jgi:O-antigen/teichoic acid export membrane protein
MTTNTRRIASNTIVQVIARVVTGIISVITLAYLTRYLGVAGYGQYNVVFAYLALFGVAVDFGFYLLQVREVVKHPERTASILGNIFSIKILLSLVVFLAAFLFSRVVYDDPTIISGILLGIASQASLSFLHIPNSLFQARLQMHIVAIVDILTRLAYGAAIIWATTASLSVLQIIGIVSIVNTTSFLARWWVASRAVSIVPRWDFQYWKYFVQEAFPLGVATVLAMIYFRIDTVMLDYFSGHYAAGIYSAPYKVLDLILTLPVLFMGSIFPIMTQALSEGAEHIQRIFSKALNYSIMVAGPVVAGVFIFATPIMVLLSGQEFAASGPVLQILIWVAALSFVVSVLTYTVIAAGRQSVLVWPYLAATAFNIIINWIYIPRYSYIGAAYTTVATELFVAIWVGAIVYYQLRLRLEGSVWVRSLAATAGMIGILYFTQNLGLFANIAIGAVSYTVLAVAFKALSIDTIKHLLHR